MLILLAVSHEGFFPPVLCALSSRVRSIASPTSNKSQPRPGLRENVVLQLFQDIVERGGIDSVKGDNEVIKDIFARRKGVYSSKLHERLRRKIIDWSGRARPSYEKKLALLQGKQQEGPQENPQAAPAVPPPTSNPPLPSPPPPPSHRQMSSHRSRGGGSHRASSQRTISIDDLGLGMANLGLGQGLYLCCCYSSNLLVLMLCAKYSYSLALSACLSLYVDRDTQAIELIIDPGDMFSQGNLPFFIVPRTQMISADPQLASKHHTGVMISTDIDNRLFRESDMRYTLALVPDHPNWLVATRPSKHYDLHKLSHCQKRVEKSLTGGFDENAYMDFLAARNKSNSPEKTIFYVLKFPEGYDLSVDELRPPNKPQTGPEIKPIRMDFTEHVPPEGGIAGKRSMLFWQVVRKEVEPMDFSVKTDSPEKKDSGLFESNFDDDPDEEVLDDADAGNADGEEY